MDVYLFIHITNAHVRFLVQIGDRLLLFYSDFRCPHAVRPVLAPGAERLAATIWYVNGSAVPDWWASGDHARHDYSLVAI